MPGGPAVAAGCVSSAGDGEVEAAVEGAASSMKARRGTGCASGCQDADTSAGGALVGGAEHPASEPRASATDKAVNKVTKRQVCSDKRTIMISPEMVM